MHEDFLINNTYTVAFTDSIRRHIDAAMKARTTPAQRGRVEAVALIADHLEAYAAMEAAEMDLDYGEAAKQAKRMFDDQAELHEIYPFFISETFPNAETPPPFIVKWRMMKYRELAAKVNGDTGRMVAPLPLEMRFVRDPFNEGVIGEFVSPVYSFVGLTSQLRLRKQIAPEWAEKLKAAGAQGAVLVPV